MHTAPKEIKEHSTPAPPKKKNKQKHKPETVYEKTKLSLFLFPNQAYFFSNIKTFCLVFLIKTKVYPILTIQKFPKLCAYEIEYLKRSKFLEYIFRIYYMLER